METKKVRHYVVLPFEVSQAGLVIKLDHKLPAHLFHCKGILATVKGFLNIGHDIQHMGEFSILLNSGQVHPLHQMVGYYEKPLKDCNKFMKVSEPLVPNYRISGFYEDAGNSRDNTGRFLPYTLKIYLDCKAVI